MSLYKDILKKANLRVTQVRKRVVERLLDADFALTPHEIEEAFDQIDRVTLYRTLKSFEQKGIIHKVNDGTGIDKFAMCEQECTEDHHHDEHIHFNCNVCGHTYCVDEIRMPEIKMPHGFSVQSTDIIVKGICNHCN